MGLGGISAWQLILILVIFLVTLLAAPIRRNGGAAGESKATGKESADDGEEPPLGVG